MSVKTKAGTVAIGKGTGRHTMKGYTPGSATVGSLLVFYERHEESGEVEITKIYTQYYGAESGDLGFEFKHALSEFTEPELRVLRAACK